MKTIGQPLRAQARTRLATPTLDRLDHYGSRAHRQWSAEVVRRANGMCARCGALGRRLIADHVREIRDGGDRTDPRNGQALCSPCHGRKTAQERAKRFGLG